MFKNSCFNMQTPNYFIVRVGSMLHINYYYYSIIFTELGNQHAFGGVIVMTLNPLQLHWPSGCTSEQRSLRKWLCPNTDFQTYFQLTNLYKTESLRDVLILNRIVPNYNWLYKYYNISKEAGYLRIQFLKLFY